MAEICINIVILLTLLFVLYRRRFIKFQLFMISFQPLFLILMIKFLIDSVKLGTQNVVVQYWVTFWDLFKDHFLYRLVVFLAIFPIIIFWLKYTKSKSSTTITPYRYEKLGESLVSYVMTYIVPLTTLSKSSTVSDYAGNIILFLLIMWLYIRLDLIYINPVLILFSFNIYKVFLCAPDGTKSEQGELSYLITKKTDIEMNNLLKSTSPIVNVKTLGEALFFDEDVKQKSK